MSLRDYFLWYHRLQKAGFVKGLKSLVSEHLWTAKKLNGPKDCLNLHGSISVRFFDHSERKPVQKFVLVVAEILKLFVNILTADDKYSLSVKASV